jgi:molecular chaperone DnaK
MQADADANAAEDAKKKEFAEAKNQADQLIHTAEKAVADAGEKIDANLKKEIMDDISSLKQAKESDDISKLNEASSKLNTSMMKIGEAMKQANDASANSTTENSKDDGEAGTNDSNSEAK